MGGLKPQDTSIGSTETQQKRPRGNPNLRKGVRNPYYETTSKNTTMAETESQTEATESLKKEIPKDIFSDEIPSEPVLPLDGEVKTKDYAIINDGSGGGGNGTIPPSGPNTGDTPPPPSGDGNIAQPTGDPLSQGVNQNPSQPSEDVKTEAEQMVKLILRGYEKLHGLGRWAGKVDDNQLMNLHVQKKINLDYRLPLGTKDIPVRDFFASYNQEIDETIVVTDEFKESITPPLVRIAIKRGWRMGDELFALMLAAEDLGTKTSLLMGLKKSANLILEACMNIQKKQNEPPTQEKNEKPNHDPSDLWRDSPSQDVNFEEVR